jgi:hypothetical protein
MACEMKNDKDMKEVYQFRHLGTICALRMRSLGDWWVRECDATRMLPGPVIYILQPFQKQVPMIFR